ncbi:MAG: DMT family transporter [bacterium]|nr:DMT family transporter [bacterium]
MWVLFAFVSATIVGIRDSFKKSSLQGNDVLTVLFLNTLFSALLFLPFILLSRYSELFTGSFFYVPTGGLTQHFYSVGKCLLLLGCWLCSYNGIKHLPLTISGIIIAFGPVETVIGAMLLYGESLNVLQWVGVAVSVGSLVAVSMSGKKEGIDFRHNRYVWVMFLSTLFSAAAALYDKLVMGRPEDGGMGNSVMFIQSWYNIYQTALLLLILLYRQRSLRKQGQGGGAFPFRLEYCHGQPLRGECGSALRCCLAVAGLYGFYLGDGSPGQRGGLLFHWCLVLPREKPAEQDLGSATCLVRYVVALLRLY